jgi:NitT/TauT family transport system substrate-binding protein
MIAKGLAAFALTALVSTGVLAQAQKTPVSLRLDWVPSAHHIGPFLAQQRGYYAAEGLDMSVRPGRGSGSTIQVVASGGDTFGMADAGTMAVAVSKGAPVVMVSNIMQRGPTGMISLGKKIEQPKELEGKSVGLVPGEGPHVVMLAVMKKYGIPESAYRTVAVEAAVKVTALLTKKVDTIPGFSFGDYLRARSSNPDVKITLFSDWGVNMLGNGYLVSASTLEQKPDLVRAFVRATIRGWQDAIKDPKAGVDAVMAAVPETNRAFLTAGLPMVIDHMHSDATKGKALGWMADEDWKTTLDIMKTSGLEGDRPTSAYYRNLLQP